MILYLIASMAAQPTFYNQMNIYLACVEGGLPSNPAKLDRATRIRLYRSAATQCSTERERAIEAAVRNRKPSETAQDVRALATEIIDQLDPGSK